MAGVEIGDKETPTLFIIIPKKGDVNWAESIRRDCFEPISLHDHSGNGNGALINVKNLEGVSIDDIQEGEILKWSDESKAFVAADLVVDITEGTPDTTKTAFRVYNQELTSSDNISLQTSVDSIDAIISGAQNLNTIKKIDTRETALNIADGKYTIKRAGVYDLFTRLRIANVDSFMTASIHLRKMTSNEVYSTIYTKTVHFDHLDPIGTIKPFAKDFNPNADGEVTWLACNPGATFTSTDYPILYSAIGSSSLPSLNGSYGFLRGASSNYGSQHGDTTRVSDIVVDTGGGTKTTETAGGTKTGNTGKKDVSHRHYVFKNAGVLGDGKDSPNPGNVASYAPARSNTHNDDSNTMILGHNSDSNWFRTSTEIDAVNDLDHDHSYSININHTHTVDIDHNHTLSGGDTETAPKHTNVKYWIKARHASQPIELSFLEDLAVNDKIYVVVTYTNASRVSSVPAVDMTTSEGFLFKGFRLV